MNSMDSEGQGGLNPAIRRVLVRPFSPAECSLRAGPGGRKLTYVDQYHVICRLNEAFGVGGWSWQITSVTVAGERVVVVGRLSASSGQSHDGCSIEPVGKDAEKAVKTCDTDALKRAARLFGVGLHLYNGADPIHSQVTRGRGGAGAPPASGPPIGGGAVSAPKAYPNKYAGACSVCQANVEARAGVAFQKDGRWMAAHSECMK